jgi:hypothetical protein
MTAAVSLSACALPFPLASCLKKHPRPACLICSLAPLLYAWLLTSCYLACATPVALGFIAAILPRNKPTSPRAEDAVAEPHSFYRFLSPEDLNTELRRPLFLSSVVFFIFRSPLYTSDRPFHQPGTLQDRTTTGTTTSSCSTQAGYVVRRTRRLRPSRHSSLPSKL